MSLIRCYECDREISDSAASCPGCGAPVRAKHHKKGDTVPLTDQEAAILLSRKKKTSHLLHLILSALSVGIWLVVWILVALSNAYENAKIDSQIRKGKKI